MIKKFLALTLCIISLMTANANQQRVISNGNNGHIYYSYCDPSITVNSHNGFGPFDPKSGKIFDCDVYAAIRFSSGILGRLEGTKIYSLKVGIAANKVDNVNFFIRKGDGTSLWEKKQNVTWGWNEIILDEPLTLTNLDEIFIGYEAHQSSTEKVIGIDMGTVNKENSLFTTYDKYELTDYKNSGSLCLAVEMDCQPDIFNNVASLTRGYCLNPYYEIGSEKPIELLIDILNEGDNTFNTVTLGCKFNGKDMGDEIYNLKRTAKANSTNQHIIKVSPEKSGKYIYTLKKAGDVDVKESSVEINVAAYNPEQAFEREVLIEEFTSQKCGNCPEGQRHIHEIIAGYEDRVSLVLHHSGYEPDDFTTAESYLYTDFYGTNQTYAPAMMFDRNVEISGTYQSKSTPVFQPSNLTQKTFLNRLNTPAVVDVDIASKYDEATRKLNVSVTGTSITDLVGDNIGVHLFLLESGYIANQNLGGRDFMHNDFVRAVLSGAAGDIIDPISTGVDSYRYFEKNYEIEIPMTYTSITGAVTDAHPENMHLVAFVANFDLKKLDENTVLNATHTQSLNNDSSAKTITDEMKQCNIYISNGKVVASNENAEISVYGINGAHLTNNNLNNGIYIVKVKANGFETVRKLIVR